MDEIKFEANPTGLPTFDEDLFRKLLDMEAEHYRRFGSRMTKITMAQVTQPAFEAMFPKARGVVGTYTSMIGIPVFIDDEVPIGALRLHKADGSEQDIWLLRPVTPEEIVIDETPFMPPNRPGSDWARSYRWWG